MKKIMLSVAVLSAVAFSSILHAEEAKDKSEKSVLATKTVTITLEGVKDGTPLCKLINRIKTGKPTPLLGFRLQKLIDLSEKQLVSITCNGKTVCECKKGK